ncbi:hypothetical protein [Robertkochia solimangrovi]|uniref:hypothetical protein n=1 Tax=Robertkochia solimangrovi TaxID=2213046 RepID=UPI00118010C3|nr:hypothetical protein [Robertkochia solimangrovi]TRZ41183.1 hypothetical protein DMZ48_18085 [Robertkochia solimangrovi]
MTAKEIKSEIIKDLRLGVASKSELYNRYKDKIEDVTLRKILAHLPSRESKLKFNNVHIAISIIWGLFLLFELTTLLDLIERFDFLSFAFLIITIYITINIWQFNGRFLLPGIFWFSVSIVNFALEFFRQIENDGDILILMALTVFYPLILSSGIYLMFYLRKNAFGYLKWSPLQLNENEHLQFED